MKATGWKGKTLGVRVGVENRQQYFNRPSVGRMSRQS